MYLDYEILQSLFDRVKQQQPLVHHLTNAVTVNDCANATLAIGGSPVMATSIEEVEAMVSLANALVINIGTIESKTFTSMLAAGKMANRRKIPVIFDPVGVGATPFRTEKAKQLLQEVKIAIVRGNASEIGALVEDTIQTRGVDTGNLGHLDQVALAKRVANKYQTVVAMSGKEDVISDGDQTVLIHNGDVWLQSITGTGCMSTSLIACCAGVTSSMLDAAVVGMSIMGVAGEWATSRLEASDGIGMFRLRVMDALLLLTGEKWAEMVRIEG